MPAPRELVPDRARAVPELIEAAARLLAAFPLLFPALAALVVVPYDVAVLLAERSGPLGTRAGNPSGALLLALLGSLLVGPLVSALHVHAVVDLREGRRPTVLGVIPRGLRVLPVAAAASIVAGLGTALGLLALILPGLILAVRWAVVAQVAATEGVDWIGALRRSRALTLGHGWHVAVFLVAASVLGGVPTVAGDVAVSGHDTLALPFAAGVILHLLVVSFVALATALLYVDLRVRSGTQPDGNAPAGTRPG